MTKIDIKDLKHLVDEVWKIERGIKKIGKKSNKLAMVQYHLWLARNLLEEAMDEQKK